MISPRQFFSILKDTFNQWYDRDPFNNSIIISFYTIFSLPGLLVIIINVTSYFYDKKEMTSKLASQIQNMVGGDTAKDIESMIAKASEGKDTIVSSILGIATLLFGATGVFYQLQQMLNKIWDAKPPLKTRGKILQIVRDRLLSLGLVLAIGFLLLVSLMLSTFLSLFSGWITRHFSESVAVAFKVFDFLLSVGVTTVLFAAMFKFLPDVKIRWRGVWLGAFLTSLLFVLAQFALGLYFGKSDPGSTYGAAGSIILIMLWVSYGGLILLFGAEFTRVYVTKYQKRLEESPVSS
jgi:membrane protein